MKTLELQVILRRVLALAVVAPIAAAACGGATASEPNDNGDDGGTADASPRLSQADPPDASTTLVDGGRFKDSAAFDVRVPEEEQEEEEEPDADIVPPDAGDPGCVVDRPAPPDAGPCQFDVIVKCDQPPSSSGAFCASVCAPGPAFGCTVSPPINGDKYQVNCYTCGVGRRTEGFQHDDVAGCASALGQYFTVIAELEAASVFAFERLDRELAVHGAPAELGARARRAARDEVRHAHVMGIFARAWGGSVKQPAPGPTNVRPLAEVALENAVEGCVRETFGALTATLQAERAAEPQVRKAMRRIAADETEHAALAWSVARWADSALDDATRERIALAMERAIGELEAELDVDVPSEVRLKAGLPSRTEARAMLASMRANLWSEPAALCA